MYYLPNFHIFIALSELNMIYGEAYVPAKEVEKIKGDSITGAFTNISMENRKIKEINTLLTECILPENLEERKKTKILSSLNKLLSASKLTISVFIFLVGFGSKT